MCGTHCSIKAWYKTGDGIFLDDTLMPETNLFHRSILLHEMVHYFQDRAGEYGNMNDCERWFHRELDAYTIQNRYLGVIGHPSRVAYIGDNCANMTSQGQDRGADAGVRRHSRASGSGPALSAPSRRDSNSDKLAAGGRPIL